MPAQVSNHASLESLLVSCSGLLSFCFLQTATTATSAPARPFQSYQRPNPQQQPAREKPTPIVNNRPLGLQSAQVTQRSDVPPASVVTTGAYIVPGLCLADKECLPIPIASEHNSAAPFYTLTVCLLQRKRNLQRHNKRPLRCFHQLRKGQQLLKSSPKFCATLWIIPRNPNTGTA